MPAPQATVGDVVMYTQFFTVADSIYAPQQYRVVPAIVVGVNADGTLDLQVFNRSLAGATYAASVAHNANDQQPSTWRPR